MSVEIGSGRLPGRKNPCLYLIDEGRIIPLAWFTSDDAHELWISCDPVYSPIRLAQAVERGTLTP